MEVRPHDFRSVTDEDLFDYQAYTSSLVPAERDSFFLSGSLNELDSLESTFELGYVKNTTHSTFAPAPIFTAFEEVPISYFCRKPIQPICRGYCRCANQALGLGPRVQTNQSETFRANSKLMGTLRDGEWQVSLNWSENKAIEQWQQSGRRGKACSGAWQQLSLCQQQMAVCRLTFLARQMRSR